jgi:glycosyltransferase involved in cell wall biosynthesis
MTVLEALTAGVPVICTDLPALREIAGDAARYVPAGDVDALSAALRDPPAPGVPAQAFSWRRSARALIAAYERALAGR